ncbi:MAG: FAD-linked oxidase C-terminal domain-containing protein [Candidatus Korobacteraceae bacterium]|jgi:D-lactate dehydrogenase (cytochrome)
MQNPQVISASAAQLDSAVEALKSLLGARASTALVQREHHSHGESYHAPAMPDAVCYPHSTEEVSEILKISAKYQVPVIPFGGGTSLEGHVNALYGGISIDLREMNKVLRVSPEDLDVTVEAGVTRQQLNKVLNNTGLTFFIDPGGESTLGGMAATRASGTTTVRYGTMRDNVLALTVVLADGRIIKTGTRARKSSAGYDLTRLFIGSEGTLGVITDLTLRLHPLPEAVSAAVCSFPSIESAVKTVIETIQFGASVARIELLDDAQMDAINRYSKTDYPVAPTLFFEFHGSSDRHVSEQAEFVQSIAEEHGAKGFQWATRLEDRDKLWEARHAAYYAAIALRPGSKGLATDACVPISRLAECIMETQQDNRSAPFPATLVGHAGDGNFHCVYAFDAENEAELAEAKRLAGRIATRALAMGGTCTGEHGVGYGKMKYLEAEHGPALDVMRTIKRALDPDNRMNPGKMVEV